MKFSLPLSATTAAPPKTEWICIYRLFALVIVQCDDKGNSSSNNNSWAVQNKWFFNVNCFNWKNNVELLLAFVLRLSALSRLFTQYSYSRSLARSTPTTMKAQTPKKNHAIYFNLSLLCASSHRQRIYTHSVYGVIHFYNLIF